MEIIFQDIQVDLIVLSIICIILIYWSVYRLLTYWQRRGVPVIQPSLPFGNFGPIFLQQKSFGTHIQDLYNLSKDRLLGIYAVGAPIILLRDPELIRTACIRDFQYFHDRTTQIGSNDEPFLLHLISLHGDEWKKMRNMLTLAFTSGKLKAMLPTMVSCGNGIKSYLDTEITTGNGVTEIRELCALYTTNVIATVAFGIDINCINNPNTDFRKYGRQVCQFFLIISSNK